MLTALPRIQQLSAHVINKIAAGEVIERPASVIKELLENSIDAGSTRIVVDIAQGGAEMIRIVDDGCGIHPDDLLLAVTSHATSKITSADDLFQVHSMGFRGEALASIAEVSHFCIRTRIAGSDEGAELEVRLGDIQPIVTCGCAPGTMIEIRQLFGNTPVRRRFLKSAATEFGHISEQFSRIALARPHLHLTLRHNEKTVYELPATNQLLDRLSMFYGAEIADQLIEVESEHDGFRIAGFVGHPSLNKSTRKMQHLFLNGRWIQDRSLQHALMEAYRGLIMTQRYPVCFLFIEMPPDQVDVNVHPTKVEVRFQDSQRLYRQLLGTLRQRFLGMDLDSRLRVAKPSAPVDAAESQALQNEFAVWAQQELLRTAGEQGLAKPAENSLSGWNAGSSTGGPSLADDFSNRTTLEHNRFVDPESAWIDSSRLEPSESRTSNWDLPEWSPASDSKTAIAAVYNTSPVPGEAGSHEFSTPVMPSTVPDPATTGLRAAAAALQGEVPVRAMQIHDCYLVVETAEGMTVIDQHALHERILYEQFRKRVLGHSVEAQRLLVPVPLELSVPEAQTLMDHAETLKTIGFDLSDFGQGTVLLEAYPVMLGKMDREQLVRDLAEHLSARTSPLSRRDVLDELLHMMSCKAAVKAGQRLSQDEIEALLEQRHLVDDAHHCPHGRPTALNLSRAELDRQFGRLGS